MRFAYADPPYIGQAKRHYGDDPRCAEIDHSDLIGRLNGYDAWALSLSSPSLKQIIAMCPDDVRVMAWVKPFAVFRPNVKRDDRLKDIQIKRARFVGGVGEPGMRFAVPSQAHVVASERLECSAVCAGCELEAVAASQPDPPAFVTVVSVKESEGLADHFDVLVCGDKVRLLPPAHAFGDVSNGDKSVPMMEKKDFQYWQRLEAAPAECGGWSEAQLKAWFETYKIER